MDIKQLNGLGVADIMAGVAGGTISVDTAFAVLDMRIANRKGRGAKPIPSVIAARNKLATALGLHPITIPDHGVARSSTPVIKATDQSADAMADEIVASGIDIPSLLAALAKRMAQPATTTA